MAAAPTRAPDQGLGVSIRGLSHRFGRLRAVDDLSLEVTPGEVLCLLGHSGCGKSTLLRLIAGLQVPDAGRIAIGGRLVTGPQTFVEPEQRGIGFMVQDYALFPHLSVIENIAFGLKRRRGAEARTEAFDLLERVGLPQLAERYPHMLSGGEQQRVALARALAPGPKLLLLDEPFSNLDRRTAARVRRETMAILQATRATVIVVTHDPEEAMELADRIVLMEAGRLVQSGSPEDLYRRPASLFAARFFGDLNECSGVCRDGLVETPFGVFTSPGTPAGAHLRICVRADAIRLGKGDLAAHVIGRTFLGTRARLTFETEQGFVFEALAEAETKLLVGTRTTFATRLSDVFIFTEPAQSSGALSSSLEKI